jgi:hypothetical protein
VSARVAASGEEGQAETPGMLGHERKIPIGLPP